MSREHKYRGLTGTGKWFKGYYCHWQNRHYIVPLNEVYEDGFHGGEITTYSLAGWRLVKPATVGEFTGRLDKNGKEIYEGDRDKDGGVVIWSTDDASFSVEYKDIETQSMMDAEVWFEIIGNIHDVPEKEGE